MSDRPKAHCTVPLCPNYAEVKGRCTEHAQAAERRRGTAAERGYGSKHWQAVRMFILRRDPWCTCNADDCHGAGRCLQASHVADHYPESRKQLLSRGVRDPDDPDFLRGMCIRCHNKSTARLQPGGFLQR